MADVFDEVRKGFHTSRANEAVKGLSKRGFDARYFDSAGEAVEAVLDLIPPGSTVGAGGSVTLQELGVLERLSTRGDQVIFHRPEMDMGESLMARKEAIRAPYFLCSSNAITMEGELVNTDGIGNRVAGMIFGPETVIVMAGVNKLVADRDEAFSRVRNVAAPANALRLGLQVPCVERGRCVDCRSPMNICRITTIISMKPIWTDLKVFLIGEPLGL
ncbi:MAG: lactate utilization protein [Actinobacteria bacterium]|nr:lactate utilization protein [Actinomycetota bacterium]